MNLKVTHNDLNELCNLSGVNSDLLIEEINIWLKNIDELEQVWTGDDAQEFFDNVRYYLKKLELITNTYNSLGDFIKNANNEYHNVDNEAKKDFENKASEDVMQKYV